MSKALIQESTLIDIAEAIRKHQPTKKKAIGKKVFTIEEDYNLDEKIHTAFGYSAGPFIIPGAKSLKLQLYAVGASYEQGVVLYYLNGYNNKIGQKSQYGKRRINGDVVEIEYEEVFIPDCEGFSIRLNNSYSSASLSYSVKLIGYDENGNEIMTDDFEEIENTMKPSEMANNINNFNTIDDEVFVIDSTDCDYLFANNHFTELIKKYGEKIKTKGIVESNYMFYNYPLEEIPFEINFSQLSTSVVYAEYMFSNASIKKAPKMNYMKPYKLKYLFNGCEDLEEIPEGFSENWDWYYYHINSGSESSILPTYLKKIDPDFFKHLWGYNPYNLWYVKELSKYPVNKNTLTSNKYFTSNRWCSMRRVVFDMDNGVPYTVNWKSQTMSFVSNSSNSVGSFSSYTSDLFRIKGLNYDKRITNDETYHLYKDDEESWTTNNDYSFYNHTSAVETINSLPDTSAYLATNGGTNTIKFSASQGSRTDGGAIGNLTEEEIAVATAKGWTITFA